MKGIIRSYSPNFYNLVQPYQLNKIAQLKNGLPNFVMIKIDRKKKVTFLELFFLFLNHEKLLENMIERREQNICFKRLTWTGRRK